LFAIAESAIQSLSGALREKERIRQGTEERVRKPATFQDVRLEVTRDF
jgi:hypothetical protein